MPVKSIPNDAFFTGLLGVYGRCCLRARSNALTHYAIVTIRHPPSAMLALALGAFYLTEDGPARLAVYSVDLEPDERRKWLEPLRCGGDAGELWKLILAATAVPTLAVTGLCHLGRWLYERSPWVLAAALGPAVFFAMKAKPESYRRLGAMLHDSAMHFAEGVIVPYNESIARFNAMAPRTPSWEELTSTNPATQFSCGHACTSLRVLGRAL